MKDYTLLDIEQFITNMEKSNLIRMKEIISFIPFVGMKLYRKALFEQTKIDIFKKALEKAKNGTDVEKQKIIEEFRPILSEFQEKNNKKVRRKIN